MKGGPRRGPAMAENPGGQENFPVNGTPEPGRRPGRHMPGGAAGACAGCSSMYWI
jgi:hypothetical protein